MKKAITMILASVLFLTALNGCQNVPEIIAENTIEQLITQQTEPVDSETIPPSSDVSSSHTSFSNYADILNMYEQLINLKKHNENDYDKIYIANYSTENNEILQAIFHAVLHITPQQAGYSIKDLNDDGTPELILLDSQYHLHSIFTTVSNCPKVLVRFWTDYVAIDNNGIIYETGYGKGENWYVSEKTISETGELIAFSFGCKDTDINDSILEYYKINNAVYNTTDNKLLSGVYTITNKNEINELQEKYRQIFLNCSETTQNSGIEFVSIKY